jgi:hypothetical protein
MSQSVLGVLTTSSPTIHSARGVWLCRMYCRFSAAVFYAFALIILSSARNPGVQPGE